MTSSGPVDDDVLDGFHDVVIPGIVAALQRIEVLRRDIGHDTQELLDDARLALILVLDRLRVIQDQLGAEVVIDVRAGEPDPAR